MLTTMATALIAPSLPAMREALDGTPRLIVSGLVLYAVGGIAGFFATGFYLLLATRALLVVAAGSVVIAVSAANTTWYSACRNACPSLRCSRPS
jgi:MFS family permease